MMENEVITTLRQEIENNIIKTIAKQILNELKEKMPKTNTWQWDWAFEETARKYGVELKQ